MKTSDKIISLIKTLSYAENFHVCIIEGDPGWGKTTAVGSALVHLQIDYVHLGSYATPLGLFNFLFQNSRATVLVDDTSGLFNNPQTMAILKAATWEHPNRGRLVRWTSTTEKSEADEFEFKGKIIIVCNQFPRTADAEAVRNRALDYTVEPTLREARHLLTEAIKDKQKFKNQKIAEKVLENLLYNLNEDTLKKTSYRTLQKMYEIAIHNPDCWDQMLDKVSSPSNSDPFKILKRLSKENLKIKDQLQIFEAETGLKRRTFFKYRKNLELRSRQKSR
ncbi:MAG: hypothetical protein A4S09_03405 [Proteobacteria bacterium SG_bin7]|nr:MAG: hypothetical protein A4S09_03405 [Proteobacteria bacterium SG_bin7]